jgi:hypothetical protein
MFLNDLDRLWPSNKICEIDRNSQEVDRKRVESRRNHVKLLLRPTGAFCTGKYRFAVGEVSYSPDGRTIAFSGGTLMNMISVPGRFSGSRTFATPEKSENP